MVNVSKDHSIRLAYLCQDFPGLTYTFIYREVFALREMGWDIVTFSVWKPSLAEISAEARSLVDSTFYVFPLNVRLFLSAHFHYIFKRPLKYMSTLFYSIAQPGETLKKRLRTLGHFGQAVYLAHQMRRQKIQHIHAHFAMNAASIAMMISRLEGSSYSFTAHAFDLFTDERLLLPVKLRTAKFIIAISNYNREFMAKLVPNEGVEEKTFVIHCGVDPETFSPQENKQQGNCPIILSIGRLIEKKGFIYLLEACKILADRGYRFRCEIIGDGPQRPLLQQFIDQNGLRKSVSLEGRVLQEKVRDYLANADLFVLPCVRASNGDQDGIPVALMEAMALEIPVFSTTVSGIPELIEHGRNGWLVQPEASLALADAMAFSLENESLTKRLAKFGRKRIETDFNIAKTAAQLSDVFRKELCG